jgi:cysteine desulfurase
MRIYLDHNAGTAIRPEAAAAGAGAMRDIEGNPSSVHRAGQRARRALEHARAQVAALIGAAPREIVFTSGGTESNNLAIAGVARLAGRRHRIVTSAIEHSSILAPAADLESRGFEVVRVAPDADGIVAPDAVAAAISGETALVTIGLANAEVGTIQELHSIAEHAARGGAVLHVDAAQAAGRIPIDVHALGCDLLTISGHKLGAPAGIGALYVRGGLALAPALLGGPQEAGLRAGTQNLIGAVAFGAAAEALMGSIGAEQERIARLADTLLARLSAAIGGLRLNGPRTGRIANTLNLTFPDVLGEDLLIALDLEGVEVSMGSACAAGAVEPSHVLLAMGRSETEARSSLRISLGWNTTAAEIDAAAEIIPRVWRRVVESAPVSAAGRRDAAETTEVVR